MVSEDMEREMVDKNDVEAIAKVVFRELGLNWKVFHLEFDKPNHRWWVRARRSDHPDVFARFYLKKGSRDAVKKSLAEMVKRKLQELDSK